MLLTSTLYTNLKKPVTPKTVSLEMNDTPIHSLKELRNNFQPEELLTLHKNGDLELWLEQQYYELEASKVGEIAFEDPHCLAKLCEALDISYEKPLSAEEKLALEQKKQLVKQYTDDAEIIANADHVAFHQTELADLIKKGVSKIYLCNDEFSLPIQVPNMEYVGFHNASIHHPYRVDQYRKAGILVSGMQLADQVDPETEALAKSAAIANGYDDFAEKHNSLATYFHERLKTEKVSRYYQLPYDSSPMGKFYNTKSECRQAAEAVIKTAYEKAESYVTPGKSASISQEYATLYGKKIKNTFARYFEMLQKIATLTHTENAFTELQATISDSDQTLLTALELELEESRDYYQMYRLDYFYDQVDINQHDYRISDGGLLKSLEAFFTDHIQYTMNDLYTPIAEIEKDLNRNCATFFNTAYSEYKNLANTIENLLDIIGANLDQRQPDETLDNYLARCCVKLAG